LDTLWGAKIRYAASEITDCTDDADFGTPQAKPEVATHSARIDVSAIVVASVLVFMVRS
jgi:hypothetical protein